MSRRALLWAACCAGLCFAVVALLVAGGWHPLVAGDRAASDHLTGYTAAHSGYRHAMRWCTTMLAPQRFRFLMALVLVGFLLARRFRLTLFAAAAIGGTFLTTPIKAAVGRHRPRVPDPVGHFAGRSFPSGHAVGAALGCAVLLVAALAVLPRSWRWLAWVGAAAAFGLTGWTRVALGAHYPSDVVGGLLYGAFWTAGALAAVNQTDRDGVYPV